MEIKQLEDLYQEFTEHCTISKTAYFFHFLFAFAWFCVFSISIVFLIDYVTSWFVQFVILVVAFCGTAFSYWLHVSLLRHQAGKILFVACNECGHQVKGIELLQTAYLGQCTKCGYKFDQAKPPSSTMTWNKYRQIHIGKRSADPFGNYVIDRSWIRNWLIGFCVVAMLILVTLVIYIISG